ncbi:MAG: Fe-S cluster assembly protein SufD, partial [Waterburya sp.]
MAVKIPFATIAKMNETAVVENIFFTGLLQHCQIREHEPQWLKDTRQQSKTWLSSLSVPTRKDEDWRFIDLSSLTKEKFVAARDVQATYDLSLSETKHSRLVFVNGLYNAELSDVSGLPAGVYVGNLDNLPDNYDSAQYFAQQHGAQDAFTALNTAGGSDIAIIWIGKNV